MSGTLRSVNWVQEQFARLQNANSAPQWMRDIRNRAMEQFLARGFPDRRDEEWRFTGIQPITSASFAVPEESSDTNDVALIRDIPEIRDSHRIVFIDGRFCEPLSAYKSSTADGIQIWNNIGDADDQCRKHLAAYSDSLKHAFAALNTAFIDDGAVIWLPEGTETSYPVHIVYVTRGIENNIAVFPRNLIVANNGSRITLVEHYLGHNQAAYLSNSVTEILVGANAAVNHTRLQQENGSAYHIGSTHVMQKRESNYISNNVSVGASIARNDIHVFVDGENAHTTLNGLYLGYDRQLIDNHTRIDHAMPNCNSWEVYKGILGDHAAGVFNGKIFVHQDAQKTDAKQTNRALLLSDDAKINTKPELEIYADDVKCTHGATVGQLDDDALFYLRARGIGESQAMAILTYAFGAEVLAEIPVTEVRTQLDKILTSHFH